jgi:excisionase family DNA binding protein
LEGDINVERLLNVREVADLLGIAPGSVYHWISQGRLPAVHFSKRCVRFRPGDVQALVDELAARTGTRKKPAD